MAKSTRSKVKRAYRAKKRTEGVYAAVEAARLQRLNAKLVGLRARSPSTEEVSGDEGEAVTEGDVGMSEHGFSLSAVRTAAPETGASAGDGMDIDGASSSSRPQKVSTHGPRNSGREQWRVARGLAPRAKRTNKHVFTPGRRNSSAAKGNRRR